MHIFLFVLLQAPETLRSDFVMKAGVLVFLLCGLLIYITITHRLKRNRMQQEKIVQQQAFMREILQSKVEVQEATFKSVGTELHDNVGQLISSALMMINIAERSLINVPDTLLSAAAALNKSIVELRNISRSLDKDWLEQFDLDMNLFMEVERINGAGELRIELGEMPEPNPMSPEQQFILFRLLQEGIQNVLRHANASRLKIAILYRDNQVEASLTDNGKGFNTLAKTTGIGIANMKQRAASLGGVARWQSTTAGTTISILLPIKFITHENRNRAGG